MAVNISTWQLMTAGFADTVQAALQARTTTPGQLTLEVTEGVFIQDGRRALLVLNDLKNLGVRIALDDFGTGYSSLGYLSHFPVDIVKIDRTFIANIGIDSVNDIIVSAIANLAHALAMTVIAEGIETIEQQRRAMELGCDAGQGFLFARPMSAANIDTLIHNRDGKPLCLPDRLPRPQATTSRRGANG